MAIKPRIETSLRIVDLLIRPDQTPRRMPGQLSPPGDTTLTDVRRQAINCLLIQAIGNVP